MMLKDGTEIMVKPACIYLEIQARENQSDKIRCKLRHRWTARKCLMDIQAKCSDYVASETQEQCEENMGALVAFLSQTDDWWTREEIGNVLNLKKSVTSGRISEG